MYIAIKMVRDWPHSTYGFFASRLEAQRWVDRQGEESGYSWCVSQVNEVTI